MAYANFTVCTMVQIVNNLISYENMLLLYSIIIITIIVCLTDKVFVEYNYTSDIFYLF